ncbi:molybdopterin-dependent oxidoreductase [Dinoroseobacter sp. PD6]|uniref:nitrate reductase n=1 Tax=Dinoroseobacter sp. PD6 TaxID=3028384 RepID=UPI00237B1E98|nr:nitrate reductase [Dinoroseobacter sp. PD6]MDD9715494.1 molybdopterin-dependent oxidoreductase [Dinoroseobacter sp. PD6]
MTDQSVCTTCPYCGVGCGVLASPNGTIAGDPTHPANLGRLCSKGSALGETLDLEGRLLAPRIGNRRASWDEALDLVANRFRAAAETHGPDSVAFYVSGQLLTEDYYVANKLIKGFIGTANIDTNSRLCMASSVAGHKRAFGTDTVPGQYTDFETAELVVLVGSNLAWCHPVLFQRLQAAKAVRPELKVVVIDPRRTATSQLADLHLGLRPDGDAVLFNLLLTELVRRDLVDRRYVAEAVSGFDAAVAEAERAEAAQTGLDSFELAQFLDLWCRTEKVVTLYSQGVNQSACGTDKVNAILNCHLATGRIGRPGMGPFSMTGQPNAMGGREVGGLANMLTCHLDLENAAHRDAVQQMWSAPTMADKPGLKAVELFDACARGEIKALWIMSTNPVVSLPDADAVAAAIRAVPFTVMTDIMADTDTGRCVDVLLPATGWGEKSGTVTNSERCISRQRRFLPTPGEARADWNILADVGRRMGWPEAFDYRSEAEVFREFARLSTLGHTFGKDFDISGLADLTDAEYDALPPTVWPVPTEGPSGGRFFADGGFYHPDGKAKMLPIAAPASEAPNTARPVRLNTGRVRDQWHTMTRTGKAPRLGAHMAEPYLEIHPGDAAAAGLSDADLAKVSSAHCSAILRVMITDRSQQGSVFVPMHWTDIVSSTGRINAVVAPTTDPVSGQPASKGTAVALEQVAAHWYGFAVSTATMTPTRPYAAIARTRTGTRAEVADFKLPDNWEAEARKILSLPGGSASVIEDSARGTARVAIHEKGTLTGLFFAAATPVALSRSHVVALIGTAADPIQALAGVPAADRPDPGAMVCACFDVGANSLRRAIDGGATTLHALGVCTRAGTNCGSCRPELEAILTAATAMKLAAE